MDSKKTACKVNELDQIISVGSRQFTYDKAGNLLSDRVNTYAWNEQGQLVEVTDGKNTTSYTYDLYGNRQTRTVNGETTTYHTMPSDLSLVLGQTDKYGETIYYYGSNGLVASEINSELVYYLYDPFGSVSEIVDQNGNMLCSFRYDEWGKVISEEIASGKLAEAATAQNLCCHGKYVLTDEGNGLIYVRARYISTDTDSFISPDPAGQTYDLNLYRYADNNPVMYMDINGEVSINSGGSHSNPFNNNPNPQNPNTYTPKAEQPPRNIFDFSDELPGDKFTKQDTVSDKQKLIEKYRKLYKEEQRLKTNIKARQWFIKNIKPLLKVALLWLGGLIVKGLIALATLLGISLLNY